MIAVVKDLLIYITVIVAIVVIPMQLGGYARYSLPSGTKAAAGRSTGRAWGSYGTYATLALGSALALFLYPHSITGILGASGGRVIRRNAASTSLFPDAGLPVAARLHGARAGAR